MRKKQKPGSDEEDHATCLDLPYDPVIWDHSRNRFGTCPHGEAPYWHNISFLFLHKAAISASSTLYLIQDVDPTTVRLSINVGLL